MSMRTKVIGRQPTDHGPYDPQFAYGKKFTVTLFDCGWESKHDNNTSAPATLNAQAGTITENTTDWKKVWGSYKQWLIDNGYQKMDASDVKDGNNTQHDINAAFANEIGSDSTPESIKGRVTNLEEAVGTGGSVDERIATEGAKHYLKSETYTKEEVNGMITTPEQGFVSVSADAQTTAATDVLPATGEADTIYRVANWDGSQYDTSVYSEYTWNTSTETYIKLSTKQVGIDDVPTAGSNNQVKSGGVVSYINNIGIDRTITLNKTSQTGNTLRKYYYGDFKAGKKFWFNCLQHDKTGTGDTIVFIKEGDGTDTNNILEYYQNGATGTKEGTIQHDCTCLQIVMGSAETVTTTNVSVRLIYGEFKNVYDNTKAIAANNALIQENADFVNNLYKHLHINYTATNNSYTILGDFKAGERFRLILESVTKTGTGATNATIKAGDQWLCIATDEGQYVDGVLAQDCGSLLVRLGAESGITAYEADLTILKGTALELFDEIGDVRLTEVTNITQGQFYNNHGELVTATETEWCTAEIAVNPANVYLVQCCIYNTVRIVDIDGNGVASVNRSIPERYYNYAQGSVPSFVIVKPRYNKIVVTFRNGGNNINTLLVKPRYCAINLGQNARKKGLLDAFLEISVQNTIGNRYYIVDKNGGGDYTSLTQAIIDNMGVWGVTLYVNEGEYDLIQELTAYYGTANFLSRTPSGRGIELGYDITIKASPKAVIKADYTGDDINMQQYFSPFNTYREPNVGGFTLIGVNIKCSRVRYCVHDEKANNGTGTYINRYLNCDFYIDNTNNSVWHSSSCIGMGLGSSGEIIIENCIMTSIDPQYNGGCLFCHNYYAAGAKSQVTCTGNYLTGDIARGFHFWVHGESTLMTQIILSNNNVGKATLFNDVDPDYPSVPANMEIKEWNTVVRS